MHLVVSAENISFGIDNQGGVQRLLSRRRVLDHADAADDQKGIGILGNGYQPVLQTRIRNKEGRWRFRPHNQSGMIGRIFGHGLNAELGHLGNGVIVVVAGPVLVFEHWDIRLHQYRLLCGRERSRFGKDAHLQSYGSGDCGDQQVLAALPAEQQSGREDAIHQHDGECVQQDDAL